LSSAGAEAEREIADINRRLNYMRSSLAGGRHKEYAALIPVYEQRVQAIQEGVSSGNIPSDIVAKAAAREGTTATPPSGSLSARETKPQARGEIRYSSLAGSTGAAYRESEEQKRAVALEKTTPSGYRTVQGRTQTIVEAERVTPVISMSPRFAGRVSREGISVSKPITPFITQQGRTTIPSSILTPPKEKPPTPFAPEEQKPAYEIGASPAFYGKYVAEQKTIEVESQREYVEAKKEEMLNFYAFATETIEGRKRQETAEQMFRTGQGLKTNLFLAGQPAQAIVGGEVFSENVLLKQPKLSTTQVIEKDIKKAEEERNKIAQQLETTSSELKSLPRKKHTLGEVETEVRSWLNLSPKTEASALYSESEKLKVQLMTANEKLSNLKADLRLEQKEEVIAKKVQVQQLTGEFKPDYEQLGKIEQGQRFWRTALHPYLSTPYRIAQTGAVIGGFALLGGAIGSLGTIPQTISELTWLAAGVYGLYETGKAFKESKETKDITRRTAEAFIPTAFSSAMFVGGAGGAIGTGYGLGKARYGKGYKSTAEITKEQGFTFEPTTTIPISRGELIRISKTKPTTTHVTLSEDLMAQLGTGKPVTIKPTSEGLGEFRTEKELYGFYRGAKQALLGYAGVGEPLPNQPVEYVWGGGTPKVLFELKTKTGGTPVGLKNVGQMSGYQQQFSGKTFVPPENLALMSTEQQLITPPKVEWVARGRGIGGRKYIEFFETKKEAELYASSLKQGSVSYVGSKGSRIQKVGKPVTTVYAWEKFEGFGRKFEFEGFETFNVKEWEAKHPIAGKIAKGLFTEYVPIELQQFKTLPIAGYVAPRVQKSEYQIQYEQTTKKVGEVPEITYFKPKATVGKRYYYGEKKYLKPYENILDIRKVPIPKVTKSLKEGEGAWGQYFSRTSKFGKKPEIKLYGKRSGAKIPEILAHEIGHHISFTNKPYYYDEYNYGVSRRVLPKFDWSVAQKRKFYVRKVAQGYAGKSEVYEELNADVIGGVIYPKKSKAVISFEKRTGKTSDVFTPTRKYVSRFPKVQKQVSKEIKIFNEKAPVLRPAKKVPVRQIPISGLVKNIAVQPVVIVAEKHEKGKITELGRIETERIVTSTGEIPSGERFGKQVFVTENRLGTQKWTKKVTRETGERYDKEVSGWRQKWEKTYRGEVSKKRLPERVSKVQVSEYLSPSKSKISSKVSESKIVSPSRISVSPSRMSISPSKISEISRIPSERISEVSVSPRVSRISISSSTSRFRERPSDVPFVPTFVKVPKIPLFGGGYGGGFGKSKKLKKRYAPSLFGSTFAVKEGKEKGLYSGFEIRGLTAKQAGKVWKF